MNLYQLLYPHGDAASSDAVLRPFGLTNGQFSLLDALSRAEPAGTASVAILLATDRNTLSAGPLLPSGQAAA